MGKDNRILVIDFCNYEDYPIGGYLTFVRNLMDSFGPQLILTGITTSKEDPVGRWFKKTIRGKTYDFFALARYNKSQTRHLIPDRLAGFLLFRFYRRKILKSDIRNFFIQRQEFLIAFPQPASKNVCYCFAGLENPLSISKYKYAVPFSGVFERIFFGRLRRVGTILASGDDQAIEEMVHRSKGKLSNLHIVKFPTRINTNIFRPTDKAAARQTLNLPATAIILVTTGRLAKLKGWKFMVDCFMEFQKNHSVSVFFFIGEGEDYYELKTYISDNNLDHKIILAGKKKPEEVAMYLNASDLFIMGSYKEGWSTSLMEANACGIPACVTDFSSAREIIEEGKNGFVIAGHDKLLFVQSMSRALEIPRPVSSEKVVALSSFKLKGDILKYWNLV